MITNNGSDIVSVSYNHPTLGRGVLKGATIVDDIDVPVVMKVTNWAYACEQILRQEPVGSEIEINGAFLGNLGRPERVWFESFPDSDKEANKIVKGVKLADCQKQMKIKVGKRTYMVNYKNCRTQAVRVASKLLYDI